MWRILLSASALLAAFATAPASAQVQLVVSPHGRTIVQGSGDRVREVVRETPSGFQIVDRDGGTERTVRRIPSGLAVTDDRGRIERVSRMSGSAGVGLTTGGYGGVLVLGTGLAGGVGSP